MCFILSLDRCFFEYIWKKVCIDNNLNDLVFVKIYDLEWKIKKDYTFNYSNIRINQL